VTGNPYAPWFEHTFVIFDVETTGLEADHDRVVELGLARFENGVRVKRWGSLVYPDREIPDEASNIHGITTVDVSTAPRFIGILADVINIARNAHPVAYNASFDKRFWLREMARTSLTDLRAIPLFNENVPWLDPLVWMRRRHGIWGGNKLAECCDRFGIDIGNAHRATDDAVATGKLLRALAAELHPITLTEMLRRQGILHERQTDERQDWFRKKGLPFER
jgi:DNA polymerase III epsilon subunit family exonuclease